MAKNSAAWRENITGLVDKTDQNSNSNKVLDYHSSKKSDSYHMMNGHLPIIIAFFSNSPVFYEVP